MPIEEQTGACKANTEVAKCTLTSIRVLVPQKTLISGGQQIPGDQRHVCLRAVKTLHGVNLDNGHKEHEGGTPFDDALTCHALSCSATVTPLQRQTTETQQIGRTCRQNPETQQFGRKFQRIWPPKWGAGGGGFRNHLYTCVYI